MRKGRSVLELCGAKRSRHSTWIRGKPLFRQRLLKQYSCYTRQGECRCCPNGPIRQPMNAGNISYASKYTSAAVDSKTLASLLRFRRSACYKIRWDVGIRSCLSLRKAALLYGFKGLYGRVHNWGLRELFIRNVSTKSKAALFGG